VRRVGRCDFGIGWHFAEGALWLFTGRAGAATFRAIGEQLIHRFLAADFTDPARSLTLVTERFRCHQSATFHPRSSKSNAQVAHDPQGDDADEYDVVGDRSTGERLTFKTVAIVRHDKKQAQWN
jgi:hypothetical protein